MSGVPVRQVPKEDILICLMDGFQVNTNDEYAEQEVAYWVRLRLEVELDIRRLLGEGH